MEEHMNKTIPRPVLPGVAAAQPEPEPAAQLLAEPRIAERHEQAVQARLALVAGRPRRWHPPWVAVAGGGWPAGPTSQPSK
jgi:hypothetical protein